MIFIMWPVILKCSSPMAFIITALDTGNPYNWPSANEATGNITMTS